MQNKSSQNNILSSHISYKFWPNMDIIRLATRKERQINIYVHTYTAVQRLHLNVLHTLLYINIHINNNFYITTYVWYWDLQSQYTFLVASRMVTMLGQNMKLKQWIKYSELSIFRFWRKRRKWTKNVREQKILKPTFFNEKSRILSFASWQNFSSIEYMTFQYLKCIHGPRQLHCAHRKTLCF
jgi:hypothetical protein